MAGHCGDLVTRLSQLDMKLSWYGHEVVTAGHGVSWFGHRLVTAGHDLSWFGHEVVRGGHGAGEVWSLLGLSWFAHGVDQLGVGCHGLAMVLS